MKEFKLLILSLIAGFVFCMYSCESGSENLEPESKAVDPPMIKKAVFSGYVQKGPFSNGSSVTVLELDKNLDQTGKTYFTTISDNIGSFEKKNIELVSNFVALKADGYYFNEVSGKTSTGQITLYALVDVEDVNTANVNVLTHLTNARIEYLVKQESSSFSQAKQRAQKEVMAVFGVSTTNPTDFESLDLTSDASLLAISSILQGSLSTGDMAGLMADIITDIRTDGKLDKTALITKLVQNAETLSSSSVRNNLIAKYSELGINANIPDIESKVQSFIDSKMDSSAVITYPENGEFGANILSDVVTSVTMWDYNTGVPFYSMLAEVPLGMSLKIVMNDHNRIGASGTVYPGYYYIGEYPSVTTWVVGLRDQYTYTHEFIVKNSGTVADMQVIFMSGKKYPDLYRDYVTIEYYENGASTPTKVKRLYLEEQEN